MGLLDDNQRILDPPAHNPWSLELRNVVENPEKVERPTGEYDGCIANERKVNSRLFRR